ncbi:MAG: ATP-dependent DNA helicase RecQ [Bacteroidia bacterium]
MQTEPSDILKQYWGFDAFRPLQEDIVRSVLAGNDTLALLPTGGGKSICFQVPGLALGGLCLVISPLIALMKDQVLNLNRRNIPATAIFTGMQSGEIDAVLENCAAGKYRFLYVSPERLSTRVFMARIERMPIRLLAIDESHCISQWGHDFRPEYLRIAAIRPFLPQVPVIALTATATPEVVEEIQEKLAFKQGKVFQKSFQRSNLAYVVEYVENKIGRLTEIVKESKGTGVVYAGTRRKTEQLAGILRHHGVKADFYHAGLSAAERDARQKDWIDNKIRVIVCTNAFGMGIDKPDVRFVAHLEPSDCIEAYFQEAGRAGRDEQPARCTLLYHESDRYESERKLEMGFPPIETIQTIYNALGQYLGLAIGSGKGQSFPFDMSAFCHEFELKPVEVHHSLQFLHRSGYLLVGEDLLIPSKVRFTADATIVYDFRLRNKDLDPFIDLLLRSYGGIMEQYVKIDELKLAGRMRLLSADVVNLLARLQQLNIIDYIPKTDKPLITWLEGRLPEDRVVLAPEHYAHLHKTKSRKLEAMLQYAERQNDCRSRLLLSYFGESEAAACGQCDYCKQLQQLDVDDDRMRMYEKALEQLTQDAISVEALVQQLPGENKKQALEAIRWFTDQGRLQSLNNQKLRWKA